MIRFTTETEFDIRAVTVLGLHAKNTDSPIGYFGTGLKYAIAVACRERCALVIVAGKQKYQFIPASTVFRGKTAEMIEMRISQPGKKPDVTELAYTTDYGKNWSLAEVYRELASNTFDENGTIDHVDSIEPGKDGVTSIYLHGTEAEARVWDKQYFIRDDSNSLLKYYPRRLLQTAPNEGGGIFCRGVRIGKFPLKNYHLILNQASLTEDRRLAGYMEDYYVKDDLLGYFSALYAGGRLMEEPALSSFPMRDYLNLFTEEPWNMHPRALDFLKDHHYDAVRSSKWGERFLSKLAAAKGPEVLTLPRRFEARWQRIFKKVNALFTDTAINDLEANPGRHKIHPYTQIADNVLAMVKDGQIYISTKLWDLPDPEIDREVTAALLEEAVHHVFAVDDCTRAMQSAIFNLISDYILSKE